MQHISNKNISLRIDIQSIRIDSKIIEALDMSVPHLIRNSMDHGLETGRGINPDIISTIALDKKIVTEDQILKLNSKEIQALIFAPGFSTAEEVSEISGRGVGMDSVKTKIESINGSLELQSIVGKGTRFLISVPN